MGTSPYQCRSSLHLFERIPANDEEDCDAQETSSAGDEHLSLGEAFVVPRRASGSAKSSRRGRHVVAAHAMDGPGGKALRFGPGNDVEVHCEIKGN
jgi:hypothetical protein